MRINHGRVKQSQGSDIKGYLLTVNILQKLLEVIYRSKIQQQLCLIFIFVFVFIIFTCHYSLIRLVQSGFIPPSPLPPPPGTITKISLSLREAKERQVREEQHGYVSASISVTHPGEKVEVLCLPLKGGREILSSGS